MFHAALQQPTRIRRRQRRSRPDALSFERFAPTFYFSVRLGIVGRSSERCRKNEEDERCWQSRRHEAIAPGKLVNSRLQGETADPILTTPEQRRYRTRICGGVTERMGVWSAVGRIHQNAGADEFLRNLSSKRPQNSICDSRKPDSTVM